LLSRALIAGVLLAAIGLTACGRKGPLEPPPAAAARSAEPDGTKPADTGPTKPDKPFLLDPLL
jgi:predicted small lipoprotein YifL